jgi:hypothetical protein
MSRRRAPAAKSSRRQQTRAPVDAEILTQITQAENRVAGGLRISTAALQGGTAFLRSDLLFEIGEELELTLQLTRGQQLTAKARVTSVVRDTGVSAAPGMTVHLLDLPKPARDRLRAHLSPPKRGTQDGRNAR